jgi:hypothetical protein
MRYSAHFRLAATIALIAVACPFSFGQFQRRVCQGDYAFCSASTCTPNGGLIRVNTATGHAYFPSATCTCPIINGLDEVEVDGGNMQGSCQAPSPSTVWSGFWPHATTPQQLADWQDVDAPGLICGSELNLANQSVNCYSFLCQRAGTVNGVPVANCNCPLGENFDGTPIAPGTAFFTQAGQCNVSYCSKHPVSDPIGFDDLKNTGECFRWPNGTCDLTQDKLDMDIRSLKGTTAKKSSSTPGPAPGR